MIIERSANDALDVGDRRQIRGVLDRAFASDDEAVDGLEDFSEPDCWLFVRLESGVIVAVLMLLARTVRVGDAEVAVGGIGGVATLDEHRHQGHAHLLVAEATAIIRDELRAPFGMLQCVPELVSLYQPLGWQVVESELWCVQADGHLHRSRELPMVLALSDIAWPSGTIDMNGLPW